MTAQIRSIHSLGVSCLEAWTADDPLDVYLPLELEIGQSGTAGSDLFQVIVTTPRAIASRPELRHAKLLVVQAYDWNQVRSTLTPWVAGCGRDGS